jgi:ATP-dependent Clp protease adaptor protein ClpS
VDVRSRFSSLQVPTAFFDGPGVDYDKGMRLANAIDATGLAVVWSGEQEQAELYWEQLKGYGLTMAPLEH